jgi:hypothetical protein
VAFTRCARRAVGHSGTRSSNTAISSGRDEQHRWDQWFVEQQDGDREVTMPLWNAYIDTIDALNEGATPGILPLWLLAHIEKDHLVEDPIPDPDFLKVAPPPGAKRLLEQHEQIMAELTRRAQEQDP